MAQGNLEETFPRRFVPPKFCLGDATQVDSVFDSLIRRKPASARELEIWLGDVFELLSVYLEEWSLRLVATTTRTDDQAAEAAYRELLHEIRPRVQPKIQALDVAYLASAVRRELPQDRYARMDRLIENRAQLFREENLPLEAGEALLCKEYERLCGAMTVTVDEQELTLPQARKFLDDPDRERRQTIWERVTKRRLADRERLEAIFDELRALRRKIAQNAGCADYREYRFRTLERFDYTPARCFEFHEAVERAVMPLVREIRSRRRRHLRVAALRPWDLDVDPEGRAPLRPFATTDELVQGVGVIFGQVDPELGAQFRFLVESRLLDLDNRKGKAPGGYQAFLDERRLPFIFMNAVGRDRDVGILLHEGGHAFHSLAARGEAVLPYRRAPLEFCEVASMGMELLAMPFLGSFYPDPGDFKRACRNRLEEIVLLFPWIATLDAFQHWIYTHPDHSREERGEQWGGIDGRFQPEIDWRGQDEDRASRWHSVPHLFSVPFYFIEYGIAQIGALKIWMNSRRDYRDAVARYRKALALGGSRSLPELFAASGACFGFDYETLAPLMEELGEELNRLTGSF